METGHEDICNLICGFENNKKKVDYGGGKVALQQWRVAANRRHATCHLPQWHWTPACQRKGSREQHRIAK